MKRMLALATALLLLFSGAALAEETLTPGTQTQRGFLNDNVLRSEMGDIHFSSYIPESYDGSEPYALFVTLPGWEGLYFQSVGANMVEDFGPEAIRYNDKMIVLSPQLNDWGQTSANEAIVLDVKPAEFFTRRGFHDQHSGGQAFAHEESIMGWLFGAHSDMPT